MPEDTTATATEQTEQTSETYKVGEKKAISEYVNMDKEDEFLARWKRSLGLTENSQNTIGAEDDKRQVVVLAMTVYIAGREPFVVDVENPESLKDFQNNPMSVPNGVKYHLKLKFRVQHEIVTGLRYIQIAKRAGITVNKTNELLGSFPPNTEEKPFYECELPEATAPNGFLLRGTYHCTSSVTDDDEYPHLEVPWMINITK